MAEIIRRIEENDFEAVSNLFNGRKSVEELKWLYSDPNNSGIYNAFVAVNQKGEIIGEIAYMLSVYTQGGQIIKGAIPFNWKIIDKYKGMAGILLFKKVLNLGDFSFTIGGTEAALNLFPLFKLNKRLEIEQFYKVLKPFTFLKTLQRKSPFKTYGMFGYLLPSYFRSTTKKNLYNDIEFIRYSGENYSVDIDSDFVFKKVISKNYIDWLLVCPVVESFAFIIKRGENTYGTCVLYTYKTNQIKKGRIVYLPFLGDNKRLWNTVITKCVNFFKKEKCCFITCQTHHKNITSAYNDSGFIRIKSHSHPVFIKYPNKKIESINIDNWHLQYSEGDKFYLGYNQD